MSYAPSLDDLAAAPCNLVTAQVTCLGNRPCLRVTPQDGLGPADLIDKPSFVMLPHILTNGAISVTLRSRLRPDAPDFARAFAGLAFRIQPDLAFESVYLRPLNGLPLNPPPPRDRRAVQYFAYPNHDFQTLRDSFPDGRFEAPAQIRPDHWHHLRLTLNGPQITAQVDGLQVLQVTAPVPPRPGQIGLWVDIGTEAHFTDLTATAA